MLKINNYMERMFIQKPICNMHKSLKLFMNYKITQNHLIPQFAYEIVHKTRCKLQDQVIKFVKMISANSYVMTWSIIKFMFTMVTTNDSLPWMDMIIKNCCCFENEKSITFGFLIFVEKNPTFVSVSQAKEQKSIKNYSTFLSSSISSKFPLTVVMN